VFNLCLLLVAQNQVDVKVQFDECVAEDECILIFQWYASNWMRTGDIFGV
jgi:hypothetical protein